MLNLPCYFNLWMVACYLKLLKSSANFTKFFSGTAEHFLKNLKSVMSN